MGKTSLEQALKYYMKEEELYNQIAFTISQIEAQYKNISVEEQLQLEQDILKQVDTYEDPGAKMYLYSFMKVLTGNAVWMDRMLEILVKNPDNYFSWDKMYQMYGQMMSMVFTDSEFQTVERKAVVSKIYKKLIDDMRSSLGIKLDRIPVEERNKNFVLVMVSQYLSLKHGPTKTVLDRCSTLVRQKNKQVMIINSGEVLNVKNRLPLYNIVKGNYNESLLDENIVEYEGIKIPFYQCEHDMPCVEGICEILDLVNRLKPIYIIHIGGQSPLCEMCDMLVPTLCVGTVPSDINNHCGQLQVIGRKVKEDDKAIIEALGKSTDDIIEGLFTSSSPTIKVKTTRAELGLNENDFLCIVVGGRLNKEVTDDFVEMMLSIKDDSIKFVFIGGFEEAYQRFEKKYEGFKDRAIDFGFTENVRGVFELCDLYVNPLRMGGGTSVVEAMNEGLPAVAMNYGDVALGCGDEFFVDDYKHMAETISKYAQDKDFYESKSEQARKRAQIMLDTDKAFCDILAKFENKLGITE